jgi:hypothetical protein
MISVLLLLPVGRQHNENQVRVCLKNQDVSTERHLENLAHQSIAITAGKNMAGLVIFGSNTNMAGLTCPYRIS